MRTLSILVLTGTMYGCGGGGGLTPEQLEEGKSLVHALQPLDDAKAKLNEKLGPPTSTDDSSMSWFAKAGDGCKQLTLNFSGEMVGSATIADAPCP